MANQRLPVITTEFGEFAGELAFCNTTLLALGRALTVLNVSGCGIKARHTVYMLYKVALTYASNESYDVGTSLKANSIACLVTVLQDVEPLLELQALEKLNVAHNAIATSTQSLLPTKCEPHLIGVDAWICTVCILILQLEQLSGRILAMTVTVARLSLQIGVVASSSSAQLVLLDSKPVEARHRERLRSLAAHKVRLKAAAAVRQNSSSSHDDDYYQQQQQQELNGSNEGDDNWSQRRTQSGSGRAGSTVQSDTPAG
eukprot:15464-Heterococcus_DN1.PRE.1